MGISQAATAVMVFFTGLLPASCHKDQSTHKAAPSVTITLATNAATSAVSAKKFDGNLGEITLTNHDETCLLLPNGSSCTFTPKILDRKNVQITLTLESKNLYGETRDFSVAQIVAQTGNPQEVVMGELKLSFTPLVAVE